jgi:hypothetical protein
MERADQLASKWDFGPSHVTEEEDEITEGIIELRKELV